MDVSTSTSCQNCHKPLSGRADKRFCNDKCRNAFHNRRLNERESEQTIQQLNRQLRKNRRILAQLCPNGKSTQKRQVLEESGFDFGVFSAVYPSNTGIYYFSYDFGFTPIMEAGGKAKVLILRRQAYMDQQSFDPWRFTGHSY